MEMILIKKEGTSSKSNNTSYSFKQLNDKLGFSIPNSKLILDTKG